jgi:hypothetical protein
VIADPTDQLGQQLLDAVQRRDANELKSLVRDNPNVVWGRYFNQLSQDDRIWASDNVR